MVRPTPLKVHAKAFLACMALIGFSLGFSWALPFLHVNCTRHGERVVCVVQQRLLGLIPFDTTTIRDLKTASLRFEEGNFADSGHVDTTDTAHLVLANEMGDERKILLESGRKMDMTRSRTFIEKIERFLGSNESRFSTWTVPLLGYGPFLPAVLGIVFMSFVLFDFVGARLRSNNQKPEPKAPLVT